MVIIIMGIQPGGAVRTTSNVRMRRDPLQTRHKSTFDPRCVQIGRSERPVNFFPIPAPLTLLDMLSTCRNLLV